MTILITRPLAAAKRTEQAFRAAGFETWIAPVSTIIPLPSTVDLAAYDAIITTSGNGIESFATLTQHRDMNIFCAGAASATIARELGFTSVFHPEKPGGKELISLIKQASQINSNLLSSPPPTVSYPSFPQRSQSENSHLDDQIKSKHDTVDNAKRFAYIRGEVVKIDIARALADIPNVHVDTYITYKTSPIPAWTDETLVLFHNREITAITFYSEHSARITLDLLRTHDLLGYTKSITALCLSDDISDIIHVNIWKNIVTGSTTNELVANLLRTREITMEQNQ